MNDVAGESRKWSGDTNGGGTQLYEQYDWSMCWKQSGGDGVSGDAKGPRAGRPDDAGQHSG